MEIIVGTLREILVAVFLPSRPVICLKHASYLLDLKVAALKYFNLSFYNLLLFLCYSLIYKKLKLLINNP